MATTYKKRGYKPKNKAEEKHAEEMASTTAEVFNTLDDTANRSEKWIEKNKTPLFYGLVAVAVLILGYLAYTKFVGAPTEKEATYELAFPKKYYDAALKSSGVAVDSLLTLGIEGADGKYGFIDVANTYSGTKAGNMANYYAGLSFLKMKKYKEAIEYLGKFDSSDELLGPTALGAIGDAFADINQPKDAIEYYQKAANKQTNNFTTPLFLYKAGQIAMSLKEYNKAEKLFTEIKDNYPKSKQGEGIEKYINSAKYAQ
ncbi:tol-pal system YbgF family protein [Tenacibaculum sp. UWU-22]|uniref:tetratricopeptide repeat protein n=1 Tax=Tenacibaculum sp. UWU-22 TaxID=3234187 RepID=UPI0034DB0F05